MENDSTNTQQVDYLSTSLPMFQRGPATHHTPVDLEPPRDSEAAELLQATEERLNSPRMKAIEAERAAREFKDVGLEFYDELLEVFGAGNAEGVVLTNQMMTALRYIKGLKAAQAVVIERQAQGIARIEHLHDSEKRESSDSFVAYKAWVLKEAWAAALKYGWCDEVRDLLERLYIKVGNPSLSAEVWVKFRVDTEVPWDAATAKDADLEQWLLNQLHIPSLMLRPITFNDTDNREDQGEQLFDPAQIRFEDIELQAPKER